MAKDWHEWYAQYDDPGSELSRVWRRYVGSSAPTLDARAAAGEHSVRLLSLCAGDGRDTIPVLAAGAGLEVDACLVELDPELAERARTAAVEAGLTVDVRTGDAGSFDTIRDRMMQDVLMLCGIFGNISDADVAHCVDAARALVRPGGTVIWTRGSRMSSRDPSDQTGDPAEWVRGLFAAAGFEEIAYVAPDDATYRVGVCRHAGASQGWAPQWAFTFTR